MLFKRNKNLLRWNWGLLLSLLLSYFPIIIVAILLLLTNILTILFFFFVIFKRTEAALQRCSYKKVFWKYLANLLENTHVEVWYQSSFIEITLRHGCSPLNLQHFFRAPFPKNTFGGLHLKCLRCPKNSIFNLMNIN